MLKSQTEKLYSRLTTIPKAQIFMWIPTEEWNLEVQLKEKENF